VLWLAVMAFASAWPDMEASVFDSATTLMADAKLRTLRCPWIISADEEATVSAKFTNPTDKPVSFLVRTRVSRGFVTLVRQDSQVVKLAPRESRELSWPVAAADAAYGRLVMVRTLAMGSAARPARENSCGILVAGVSGIGGQGLFVAGVHAGFALMSPGAALWRRRRLSVQDFGAVRRGAWLALMVVASLVTGMMGWWLASHLLLVGAALMAFVVLEAEVSRRR